MANHIPKVSKYKKGPTWYLGYRVNGRLIRECTGTSDEGEAENIRIVKQAEFVRSPHGLHDPTEQHRNMTWEEFAKLFLEHSRKVNRPKTADAYGWCFQAFERLAKPRLLRQIDVRMLGDFAAERKGEVKAPTVNKDLRAVRHALNWAKERHYLRDVPGFKGLFVREKVKLPVVVLDEHFQKAIEAVGKAKLKWRDADWWEALLQFIRYSGARLGEPLGLKWKDANLGADPSITIRESKGQRERLIPLDAKIAAILTAWKTKANGDPAVFPWPYENRRRFYDDWGRLLKAAKVPYFRPKDLRSTCGSEMAVTEGLTTVQQWLGHSSVQTTAKFYINPTAALRQAAQRRSNGQKGI